ncbi:MAG: hypothetical protein JST26_20815 [Bacteroidetes bacterium]|nr:hypothetical protein [Bacteroidota bacterium]
MSSPFNYELDERQIRIMLQNAELDYDATAWEQFNATSAHVQPANAIAKTNRFGFGISRQVLVPAFFILVVGGLSALLFSFVNFKKTDNPEPERLLENNTASFVVEESSKQPVQAKSTPVVTVQALKKDSAQVHVSAVPTHTQQALVKQAVVNNPVPVTLVKQELPKTISRQEDHSRKKRRRKQETAEELPSINASSSFNAAANEPEPEIKVN